MCKDTFMFYKRWLDSEEYSVQSCIENEKYEAFEAKISSIAGKELCYNMMDSITEYNVEIEQAGFEQGMRYGIAFICGMLKGGVLV